MRLSLATLFLSAMTSSTALAEEVRVLNWSEYIVPGLIEAFEAETGIDVVYDHYESGEVVESRLLTGGSDYDLVVISSEYLGRLIEAGAISEVDWAQLSVTDDLSPDLMARLAIFDPGNRHAIPYLWGTTGIGYDRDAILSRFPDAPLGSWAMVFDPNVVSRFQDCGVSVVDSPEEVLGAALLYLGHDPNTSDPVELTEASDVLKAISPFISRFDSEQIWDMAEGRSCLALGWSTDIMHAADMAADDRIIEYSIPSEGGMLWYDSFVVPADAANKDAAVAFADFLLRAENIAAATNLLWAPSAVNQARSLIDPEVLASPFVFPQDDRMAALNPILGRPFERKRSFAEVWSVIKLGF